MKLIMFIASGCGAGYLPWAPGTWGSLAAIALYLPLAHLSLAAYCAGVAAVILVGIAAAGGAEKILDTKDPGIVVIDEIAGMLVALAGQGTDPVIIFLTFCFFRLFDIVKPFPANWIDTRLGGGIGIVMDDVVAGLYAWLAVRLAIYLFS